MDGVWRGAGGGRRQGRHLLLPVLADGAERNPGKCLNGGVSLGGGAVQERPETPVELHRGSGRNSALGQRAFHIFIPVK